MRNLAHFEADDRSIMDFNNFFMSTGLSDTGFSGNSYTWTNNRQGDDMILERLDCLLVNGYSIAAHGFPKVTYPSIFASDHSPILSENENNMKAKSRFHCMKIWERHPGFKVFLQEQWGTHA